MSSDDLPAVVGGNGRGSVETLEPMNMSDSDREGSRPGLRLNDILFVLYRHKWKILLCAFAGFGAAAVMYFLVPPAYETEAKLLVRYVVDRSVIDGLDSGKTPGSPSENVINSEVEILTSSDLAMQVADAVGVDRLARVSGSKATTAEVALGISKALKVVAIKDTNIISVSYQNEDPKLAMEVLQELVKRYFDKHLEVHRSAGTFDFVTRQTDQLRAQLNQTDEELKQLKAKAGITSLAESTTSLATELTKTQEDLDAAEAELASQQARTREIEKSLTGEETKQANNAPVQVTGDIVREYQDLVTREAQLRQMETDLLARYTAQNRIVKVKQAQIQTLVNQRRDLEKKHPGLLATVSSATSAGGNRVDIVSERARLAEIVSKRDTLKSRLAGLQEKGKLLSEYGPRIGQLERTKEVQEANYKYLEASLEKARIDETLDPARMPNISVVQKPEMGVKVTRDALKKILIGLAAGGMAVGIASALLIELVLDRTVKRPIEMETRLRIPLLLSIPNFALSRNLSRLRLPDANHDSKSGFSQDAEPDIDPSEETGALLRPFCDAIRDRLGLFFELNGMNHKPKMVAVTGLSKNAGASTLATGLAASLSEGSEGKVLLVDKPVAPKRFYDMLLEFKESDFNYVVFDMPSLGPTSATLPLAGFMDKVLLVVEAEKSNGDAVKRAYSQLSAKSNVSVVFNKSRSYGPKWLEGEI